MVVSDEDFSYEFQGESYYCTYSIDANWLTVTVAGRSKGAALNNADPSSLAQSLANEILKKAAWEGRL